MMGLGALVWMAGMLTGLVEVVVWLKDGAWAQHHLLWVTGTSPTTDWAGVNQILSWLWMQPLWGVVATTGLALVFLGLAAEKS